MNGEIAARHTEQMFLNGNAAASYSQRTGTWHSLSRVASLALAASV
jgi:hypothetical protein